MAISGSHGEVTWVVSERADGDFCPDRVDPQTLRHRQRRLVDAPWTLADQVHGRTVLEVAAPGERDGETGDVIATTEVGAVIGIWAGDCVPILFISAEQRIAMAHVGWRGLVAGTIDAAVDALGGVELAVIGPHIGPCCYAFSPEDLRAVAAALDVELTAISPQRASLATGTAERGAAVLDMGAAVRIGLARRGIDAQRHAVGRHGVCTGCDRRWFSHRVRRETARHVMAAWRSA